MNQEQLLYETARLLDALNIEYMLTGSIVSSLLGEPRSTHDIDIVIAVWPSSKPMIEQLSQHFSEPDYYFDRQRAEDAIQMRQMFNVLDLRSGEKIDFWPLTDDEFDRSRFRRREIESVEGNRLHISTPEDTILMKLKWAKDSGASEKQFTDALRVFEVQHNRLDAAYLDHWAKYLNVEDLLDKLRDQADRI